MIEWYRIDENNPKISIVSNFVDFSSCEEAIVFCKIEGEGYPYKGISIRGRVDCWIYRKDKPATVFVPWEKDDIPIQDLNLMWFRFKDQINLFVPTSLEFDGISILGTRKSFEVLLAEWEYTYDGKEFFKCGKKA